jgi:hypothetical protein
VPYCCASTQDLDIDQKLAPREAGGRVCVNFLVGLLLEKIFLFITKEKSSGNCSYGTNSSHRSCQRKLV